MNTNTNYTDARMNLNDVCNWLDDRNYNDIADIIKDKFSDHVWTKDGMTRVDVIKDILDSMYGTVDMFRAMECDVVTHMNITPSYEAHVD